MRSTHVLPLNLPVTLDSMPVSNNNNNTITNSQRYFKRPNGLDHRLDDYSY